jgi:hypothetical protein
MLLSAGGFVRLRTESHVFNTLAPRFGGLRTAAARRQALDVWIRSDCHILTGLPEGEVREIIERECRGPGDFLRLIMETMARRQGARRWAETTPDHLLHMPAIAREIPGALFIHVIRDGRDVAASMAKQGWIRPLPIDRDRPALAAAAYWRWLVERGVREGALLGDRYLEVRYEDLVESPEKTLHTIGAFIDHPLDWAEIQRVGVGSVGRPNTSFAGSSSSFIGRWRTELAPGDARDVDRMLASRLRRLGYVSEAPSPSVPLRFRSAAYTSRFAARNGIKHHTFLGRWVTDLSFFTPGSMQITPDKLPPSVGASPG